MPTPLPAEPLSVAHLVAPHATDTVLRAEAPVHYVAEHDAWVVSRHAEVEAALHAPDTFSNRFGRVIRGRDRLPAEARAVLAEGWPAVDTLFTTDPPEHRRFRKLVTKAFSARRVQHMADGIAAVAAELLGTAVARREVDWVEAYAVPLPLTVIADQLGVPRADLPLMKRWSEGVVTELSRLATPHDQVAAAHLVVEFQRYFHSRIVARRRARTDDLLSDLVAARSDAERPLDDAELLMMLQQLLVAGNETTTNALSAMVLLLAERQDLQARLRAAPGLLGGLVEEVLRLESPIQGMWRVTTRDVELAGVTIPANSLVMLRYLAANHDPARHPDPEEPNPARPAVRDHLAFGAGIHYCVGAALARTELTVTGELLLARTRRLRLADGHGRPAHRPHVLIRGLESVRVVLD
jgi:cytochrome P450